MLVFLFIDMPGQLPTTFTLPSTLNMTTAAGTIPNLSMPPVEPALGGQ